MSPLMPNVLELFFIRASTILIVIFNKNLGSKNWLLWIFHECEEIYEQKCYFTLNSLLVYIQPVSCCSHVRFVFVFLFYCKSTPPDQFYQLITTYIVSSFQYVDLDNLNTMTSTNTTVENLIFCKANMFVYTQSLGRVDYTKIIRILITSISFNRNHTRVCISVSRHGNCAGFENSAMLPSVL